MERIETVKNATYEHNEMKIDVVFYEKTGLYEIWIRKSIGVKNLLLAGSNCNTGDRKPTFEDVERYVNAKIDEWTKSDKE